MPESKSNRRQQEDDLRQKGRIPPGQALTLKFPVLHYGPVPSFDPSTWDFRIWGEVEKEERWDWNTFQDLPRTKLRMDIHCVTRWSKADTEWEGVSLQQLVEQGIVRPKPEARFVLQHCEHGFTTNLPIDIALADNFLLATHFDGKPLTPEHGYPLRGAVGFIPGKKELKTVYFWKGGKWLRSIEFMSQDRLGFWEQAGYHNDGDVWTEQRTVR
jgi:DMSO/TMAO reductase YedYZ molybdopterin-dependent catalytic subunit